MHEIKPCHEIKPAFFENIQVGAHEKTENIENQKYV